MQDGLKDKKGVFFSESVLVCFSFTKVVNSMMNLFEESGKYPFDKLTKCQIKAGKICVFKSKVKCLWKYRQNCRLVCLEMLHVKLFFLSFCMLNGYNDACNAFVSIVFVVL